MNSLIFVTGNKEKMRDARYVLRRYGIAVEQATCEIDEIQHHEPTQIALAKARAAYAQLQKPLVINDSNWSIPALNNFPGGYMKDITAWLSTDDFLSLMRPKNDRRILLHEIVVFIDEAGIKLFEARREGVFVMTPAGNSGPSFARVVKMEDDNQTIAEIFDREGERDVDPIRYEHWHKFADWYRKQAF